MLIDYKYDIKFISVNGKKISTIMCGKGETTIVLLHGGGVLSPILEYKALAHYLSSNYKLLLIETFGYGFSDISSNQRTIANICEEIHDVITSYQLHQYVLMGHSISGVYSLYYANQYPDEVLAFIGIDSSVPKQNDYLNLQALNVLFTKLVRFSRKINLLSLRAKKESNFLPNIHNLQYSPKEKETFKHLYLTKSANDNVLDEMKRMSQNFKVASTMTFPDTVPTLFLLSTQSCRQIKVWEQLHLDIIKEINASKIIVINGSHFLHYEVPERISEETKQWLKKLVKNCNTC